MHKYYLHIVVLAGVIIYVVTTLPHHLAVVLVDELLAKPLALLHRGPDDSQQRSIRIFDCLLLKVIA